MPLTPPPSSTVAVTGAAGGVGSILARGLRRDLRLLDIRPAPGCEVLDVRDLAAVEAARDNAEAFVDEVAGDESEPFDTQVGACTVPVFAGERT